MPIYEYKCTSCGLRFERLQPFSASSKCQCLKCGQPANRLISKASFVLKGTGWYVTDHPSKERKEGMRKERSPIPAKPSKKTSSASTTSEIPSKISSSSGNKE